MSAEFIWGTVTAVNPLRVQLDGDTAALPFTPDSLIDPLALAVNERVRCEQSRRRVVIHGRSGGGVRVPAGCILHTAAVAAPSGWLLCDGSNVSRTTFADLFAAIGTTYGAGNGTTTFTLPNLRGRTIVHRDSGQTEFDTIGEAGGAKTHTLTVPEMPSHNHVTGSVLGVVSTTSERVQPAAGTGGRMIASSQTIAAAGGGGAHNNLQPYLVLNAIIKT
jgi:microcystin-dependent protein